MPVAFIVDFPGGTVEQYDALAERVAPGGTLPPGALFHVAGAGPAGLRVVDVWESDAPFEDFTRRTGPLGEDVGLPQPTIARVEVHEILQGGTPVTDMRFFHVVRFPGLDLDGFEPLHREVMAGDPPADLSYHVNGRGEDGWVVADGWSSREARDRFMMQRVIRVAVRHPAVPRPQVEDLEVHVALQGPVPAGHAPEGAQ